MTEEAVQADTPKATCCDYAPDPADLPATIRHLRGSHPDLTDEITEKTNELAGMIRPVWARVFGGPLKVDFVCANPDKQRLLLEVLKLSDIVPIVFGMSEDTVAPDRFRVVIEL